MNIRQAVLADKLTLSALCVDVQHLHAENHPGIFKIPKNTDFAAVFFEDMLADPQVVVYVAEENGQALGYILCKLMERAENPFTYTMRYLLIDQISVRPESHRKGIGAALIERAVTLAGELELPQIQLDSWGFNTNAHVFSRNWDLKNSTIVSGETLNEKAPLRDFLWAR